MHLSTTCRTRDIFGTEDFDWRRRRPVEGRGIVEQSISIGNCRSSSLCLGDPLLDPPLDPRPKHYATGGRFLPLRKGHGEEI